MPTTIDAIQAAVAAAGAPGFRGRLLARGQARAMIWRAGVLPPNAPEFAATLSYDLHSYGYSLLLQGLRLRELGGDPAVARTAFEQAATALEAATMRGAADRDRSFHLFVTGAAYHLARYSARAYSVLAGGLVNSNFSPIEQALTHVMMRDLESLERLAFQYIASGNGSDAGIRATFAQHYDEEAGFDDPAILLDGVDTAITDGFFHASNTILLAFERGERGLLDAGLARIRQGLAAASDLNLIPQWWAHKLALHLMDDLWDSSFHERLPLVPQGGVAEAWPTLRRLFLALLLRRRRSEINLWPSQLEAAQRSVDDNDNLVVSLPTSAGKTRVAELCILRALSAGKRVVFVTPLRALSAQTEIGLQRTFGPLGKTISALYGSIGVSGVDEDAMRTRNIVVATPEKLDFALRNDPTLLNDVGLLVFDEGHMIGLSEREVRYEVQIQRLLRRADAAERRIVCLSAILPDGEEMDDFANWLRRDQAGEIVKSDWRPTRLQFGEVVWNGEYARLNLRVGAERPFVPRFFNGFVPPVGRRKKIFPSDLGELCLATAWRLVEDGQTVLIFCPVRAHVEPFADRILDLHARGALASLLTVPLAELQAALTLGAEWLGEGHAILECLKLGIAIHHGQLPTAYRKEVERLLQKGILKVTISSPTLAQGLNLSATVVVMHSLFRNRDRIAASEFKNVIGRAGRAFVDVEGLVLYPIFDQINKRTADWQALIADLAQREMESGLLRLVITLLQRLLRRFPALSSAQLADYVLNNAQAWEFPEIAGENPEEANKERKAWETYITTLDTAVLSLIGEADVPEADLPAALDGALQSSLWQRRLERRNAERQALIKSALQGRAKFIWRGSDFARRKGYFLAGLGFRAGHALDRAAPELNSLLVDANVFLSAGDVNAATAAVIAIAERVFEIPPFVPDAMPANWRDILRAWLGGAPMAGVGGEVPSEMLQFVENALIYKLPWAMEAIRVRGLSHHDPVGDRGATLNDFDLSVAVPAVETGTMNRSAALLIQAGFSSRLAAIKAVQDAGGAFTNGVELRAWLTSQHVLNREADPAWPTQETRSLWDAFKGSFARRDNAVWRIQRWRAQATWLNGRRPANDTPVRIVQEGAAARIHTADATPVGAVASPINPSRCGLVCATVGPDHSEVLIEYSGPDDLWLV